MSSPEDFQPSNAAYLYLELADFVAAQIQRGDLKPGARLPPEREFAEEYGVSIGTARRATRELRERGLVTTLPIKGTFVMDKPGDSSDS
ncbi:winged helix-turn-helix domain-containing protein [Nocardiopsis exhalans]|uniref:Winged helix-turn-helix domain-containing protein n=1 Tax=Nocardiopsis exhalans TaxID=163604 RepID=A0ABY5D378_9ACTN|nr:winged helix-turn-helix domain-containing protein [Nocardiopsis exhalans]USY18856.1 winged helix-turn-helix domain-containing protein [Nocardiopsis exhalans]